MTRQLDRLESVAEDMGDALTIAQRALGRIHDELMDARAREQGQRDLPLPGTPADAVALVAEPALTRAAILGELDALDDALTRGDTDRARAAIWNLRDALNHIHESV